jgi:TetR/AcrR family transcriptional regulator, transcriptional repressor for nem operon
MTDSAVSKMSKRDALVGAATQLLVERGLDAPTIADIAEHAQVPPGNVYYYFKTRDELIEAVIDARADEVRALLAGLDQRPDPRARLTGLIRNWSSNRDHVVSHGCPIGSFTSELNKRNRGLDERAAGLLATIRDWITTQFRLLGQPHPRDLAHRMLSSIQGSALLTNTFRDPTILAREMRYLESWIKDLPADDK